MQQRDDAGRLLWYLDDTFEMTERERDGDRWLRPRVRRRVLLRPPGSFGCCIGTSVLGRVVAKGDRACGREGNLFLGGAFITLACALVELWIGVQLTDGYRTGKKVPGPTANCSAYYRAKRQRHLCQ
jgi:hypothetical protein